MTQRFTLALIATARACGVEGPHVRYTGSGPRLVGIFAERPISVPFPTTIGRSATNRAACRALAARLAKFGAGGADSETAIPACRRKPRSTRSTMRDCIARKEAAMNFSC